ncbi:hypothetical protein F511_35654 [Dorcoceras hygrometricum]|uniref:Uncharacterized protein n=1 Tax=Dorcoceras hygrometricum TaxID=472368 RepID=A0A2Z7BT68_9LAMI|nr:hypothetical protein F511_35654 [Dorcoceras hygrometricum]
MRIRSPEFETSICDVKYPVSLVVDWAAKMRIRSPEFETSICDVKYPVSLSTRCVLGKWVCLVTHAMSLFDLQDVCMVIGSLATLDLPMVADLIGIFVWKGPYCTLTMTDWFLQALSVIPSGSWGDVSRRFTMIRWGPWGIHLKHTKSSSAYKFLPSSPLLPSRRRRRRQPPSSEFVPTVPARRFRP